MTMNSSGPISLAGCTAGQSISKELALSGTAQISLNCTNVRTLAGVASGAIIMPTNFYGKSSGTYFIAQAVNPIYSNSYGPRGLFITSSGNIVTSQAISSNWYFYTFNSSGVYQSLTASSSVTAPTNGYATNDSSGNYYIYGNTGSSGAFVTKLNSSFSPQWSTYIATLNGIVAFQGLSTDSAGNTYAARSFTYSNGTVMMGVIKYNTSGTIQYQVTFAPNGNVDLTGYTTQVTVSPNGSYLYLFSYNMGTFSRFGLVRADPSNGNPLAAAYYIYSASYNFYSNYLGTGSYARTVCVSDANNLYVAWSVSTNSPGIATVIKFSGGNLTSPSWGRQLSISSSQLINNINCFGLCIDSSENSYALFQTFYSNTGGYIFYIVKYNSSGVIQWQRSLLIFTEGFSYLYPNLPISINIDSSSNIYISGNTGTQVDFLIKLPGDGSLTGTFTTNSPYSGYEWIYSPSNLTESSYTLYTPTSVSSYSLNATSLTTGSYTNPSFSTPTVTNTNTLNLLSYTSGYGSNTFSIPGTYTWVAPAGVTKVSVVAIGAGGAGFYYTSGNAGQGGGGGGGGLGYLNNYSVTPGNSYTVVVGAASTNSCGGNSYFVNTSTVKGGGGSRAASGTVGGAGGTYTGTGGGNGGAGGNVCSSYNYKGGGGGAGGYSGNGGAGGFGKPGYTAGPVYNYRGLNGSGGGGGGGAGGCGYPAGILGGGGGGVWVMGSGSSGTGGGTTGQLGQGGRYGSSGTCGTNANAGFAGGGGGAGSGYCAPGTCCNPPYCGYLNMNAGHGAVRIVWPGCARSFPSTNTGSP